MRRRATTPFFEELIHAAARGVPVRLLFGRIGSHGIPVLAVEDRRQRRRTSVGGMDDLALLTTTLH